MALVKSRAIVLRGYRLGETSKVVVCYTRDHGKVRLVAKGVRKGGGRFGAALEPFVVSGVVFYLRPGRDLSLVSEAALEREFRSIRRDVVRQAYAGAVVELTDLLVAVHSPDPELFDLIEDALATINGVAREALDVTLWRFELGLASALGYSPELDACVACGRSAGDEASFSPGLGGVVCDRCGAASGRGAVRGRAAEAVRRLGDSGAEGVILSDVERDEVGAALAELLATHAGRAIRLRSMEFLAQVRRLERSQGGSGSDDEEAA